MSLQTMASQQTSGWQGPIEITWRGSVAMPSIPIHCRCMGGWFVLKSIAHGSKCPIELCLPIVSWLMKTCSEFTLHLPDAANEVTQIVHVYMLTSGMGFVKTININFTDNLPTFPITKSLWSYLKLLLICLLELGFGFDQSLPRGQPVGKSTYYRSFDRSANWRVKDSIMMTSSNGNISALLALCAGNSPVTGEFPAQRPVTWSFDVFFDLHLNECRVNNHGAGDFRRHRTHYDVTAM